MKTAILIILLIAVAFGSAYYIFSKPAYPMTEGDAKKFFLEDLKEKYPGADVREIIEILPQKATDGSDYFQLKARVTTGLNGPCPERMHIYYDYPPKNFVAQPPEYITRGCRVCIDVPVCILAFPEDAIIASHTYAGTEDVANFIKQNADVTVDAQFMDEYKSYKGIWYVTWTSVSATKAYVVVLSRSDNKVLEIESVPVLTS